MLRLVITLAVALTATTGTAATLPSHGFGTPVSRNVAYLTQDVTLDGSMGASASVAPLSVSSAGFGAEKNATKLPGLPVSGLPRIAISNPTDQDAALAAAKDWTTTQLPLFRSRLSGWLKQQGLPTAFYSYNQEIMVNTPLGPKKRAIAFNLTEDEAGRPLYGDPKIVDADPTFLEAKYTPLRAVAGLPADWKYPNAGQLEYRILNKRYEPLTSWASIQTNGAFDSDPDATDPGAKVACLMDLRNPGCSGPIDIQTLIGQQGTTGAVVDYVRQLEPAYDELPDGTQVARGAVSVDARIWDCATYLNRGYFGYVVTTTVERYMAQPTTGLLNYKMVLQAGRRGISPTTPYEKQVPVSALGGANPNGFIISPNPGETNLWSTSDSVSMRNVVYVAPVVASGDDGQLTAASFSGDMAVKEISASGGVREYYIGTVGDNYWSTGDYPRTVTFNLKDPGSLEELAVTQEGYDDFMLVAMNGTMLFNGPFGGDMLSMGYGYTTTSESNCSTTGAGWDCWTSYDAPTGGNCTPVTTLLGTTYSCATSYAVCDTVSNDDGTTSYSCHNGGCPTYLAQTQSNAVYQGTMFFGGRDGCYNLEQNASRTNNTYIDLRPYVHSGVNSLFMHVIVGGNGEGWLRVRTRSCGSSFGLDVKPPPAPPADASSTGVSNTLLNKAGG